MTCRISETRVFNEKKKMEESDLNNELKKRNVIVVTKKNQK